MQAVIKRIFSIVVGVVYVMGAVIAAYTFEHHQHHHVAEETGHVSDAQGNADQLPVGVGIDHFSFVYELPARDVGFALVAMVLYVPPRRHSARAPPRLV